LDLDERHRRDFVAAGIPSVKDPDFELLTSEPKAGIGSSGDR
jgi:hypothetical protein